MTPADWYVFHGLAWPAMVLCITIKAAETWLEEKVASFRHIRDDDVIVINDKKEQFWKEAHTTWSRILYITLVIGYAIWIIVALKHASAIQSYGGPDHWYW